MAKRNFYLIFGIVALLGLGVLLGFLWKQTGSGVSPFSTKLPEITIVPQVPQATASAFQIAAALPEVKKLAVYEYSFPRGDPKERVQHWARTLGFTGPPQDISGRLLGTVYHFEEGPESLTVDLEASYLLYSIDLSAAESALSGSFLPSPEQAAVIVERTVKDLGFYSPSLKFAPQKTRFFKKGSSRPQPATASSADFLEVRFTAQIGDYLLYLDSGPSLVDPIIAWVGKDGRVLYLEYHPVGSIGEKIGDYPLKSREEILADLQAGRGIIVESDFLGKPDISSLVIRQVSLGYLLPLPDVNVLQPIYVLRGTAEDKSGERITLTIYLPAVKST